LEAVSGLPVYLKPVAEIAPKDQSNRRKRLPRYAVWEIHPVMALRVVH
jgi:hypothetical protein